MKKNFLKKIASISLTLEQKGFVKESQHVNSLFKKMSATSDPLYFTNQTNKSSSGNDDTWLNPNVVVSQKNMISNFKLMIEKGMSREQIVQSIYAPLNEQVLAKELIALIDFYKEKEIFERRQIPPEIISKAVKQRYEEILNAAKYEHDLFEKVYPQLSKEVNYVNEKKISQLPIYKQIADTKDQLEKLLQQAQNESSATGVGAFLKAENVLGTFNEANKVIEALKSKMDASNESFEQKKLLKSKFQEVKKIFDAIIEIGTKLDPEWSKNWQTYSTNFEIAAGNYLNLNADYNKQYFEGMEEYRKNKGY